MALGATYAVAVLALLIAFGAVMRMLGLRAIAVGLLITLCLLGAGARPHVCVVSRPATPHTHTHWPICLEPPFR